MELKSVRQVVWLPDETGGGQHVEVVPAEVFDALRKENEALLKGLRGKHALTGATYEHLIDERDELLRRVAELEKR